MGNLAKVPAAPGVQDFLHMMGPRRCT